MPTADHKSPDNKQLARTARALGNPARLAILAFLRDGEQCVCRIQPAIGLDMSTVSRHLAQLRDAGLVEDERRGAQVFYRLADPGTVAALLDALATVAARERQEVSR
ncbi:MAG: hypothetical protein Kow0062_03290 [Acidobacteriota bacterium]|nr:MAG: ArsR family transcriptional regulator [Acidobacteriota bacterium]